MRVATLLAGALAVLALVALPAGAETSAGVKFKRCGTVVLQPNTENAAVRIRAFATNCRRARKVARDVGLHARGRLRYPATEGFFCRGRRVRPDADLPHVRWRCLNGLAIVTFRKN